MEPWLAGNARGPSTAFCLLYRLFELKPTEEEVQATITHEDSVYIRAVRGSLVWFTAVLQGLLHAEPQISLHSASPWCGHLASFCKGRAVCHADALLLHTPNHVCKLSVAPNTYLVHVPACFTSKECVCVCACMHAVCCRLGSCTCAMWQTLGSCGAGWGPTVMTRR